MTRLPRPTALLGPALLALVGLLSSAGVGAATAPAAQDGPTFTLVEGQESLHDFGTVQQGETLEHVFELVAGGSRPLIVEKLKPSCGCLLPQVRRWDPVAERWMPYSVGMPIRPGTKLEIRARVKTDGRTGILKTRVNIRTNASSQELALGLNADIRPILEVKPTAFLSLGDQPSTEDLAASFVMQSPRLGAFDLAVEERGRSKDVEVELTPLGELTDGKAERWRVDLRIRAPHKEGQRSWLVRVRTNTRLPNVALKNFERHFTVQAHITGKVSVQTEYFSFGMIENGTKAKDSTTITVHDGHRLTGPIEPLIIPNDRTTELDYDDVFDARVTLAEDGLSVEVELELENLPADYLGTLSGILQVPIGHPDREVVQIRFAAVVRAPR